MSISQMLDEINAIDVTKEGETRDGYTQIFREVGSSLTHYLRRDSDGVTSPEAGYTSISKLDNYYSSSAYYGEGVKTAQEFAENFALEN